MMQRGYIRLLRAGTLVLAMGPTGVGSHLSTGAYAASSDRCERIVRQAGQRSLVDAFKCALRTRRSAGAEAPACRSRVLARFATAIAQVGPGCGWQTASLTDVLEECVASTLAEVAGRDRCAAGKLRASGACFRTNLRVSGALDASSGLCRAFDRAGDCEGDCARVGAALAACARNLLNPGDGDPPPPPDGLVVAFSAYEADAIATSSVVGQDDVTDTARVVIEPGSASLVVVLASYEATIWRFEGATARVRQVLLVGDGRHGVTGVAPEVVGDLPGAPAWDALDAPTLERLLGRPIDVFAQSYSVGTLALPSATVNASAPPSLEDTPPGFDRGLYLLATFFSPGGVVSIDPADVVPLGRAEAYGVVPQGFGLAQLVASGQLQNRDGYFYIAQPIRFPAGLHGAHSTSFVLGRGVPLPAGDPGHSCVISEETGQPLGESFCRTIEPASCELPAADPGDQVVLFGAYEGDTVSTATVTGQDGTTGTARVVIEPGAEPLYVVLSAYDSTIWRFEGATARVRQVVLVGVRSHGVVGITADRVADLTSAVDSLPDARCFAFFFDVQSPEGVAARAAVEAALGAPVGVFAASYEVGAVSLPSARVEPSPAAEDVPPGFDPEVWGLATWFSPGGVVAIDSEAVVPSGLAETYVVLPQRFGLAALVADGALQYRGMTTYFPEFYIAEPIPRFPAGLHGAHSVRFVLGRGVPMPSGDPGHSCVVSEETGEPLANDILCSLS